MASPTNLTRMRVTTSSNLPTEEIFTREIGNFVGSVDMIQTITMRPGETLLRVLKDPLKKYTIALIDSHAPGNPRFHRTSKKTDTASRHGSLKVTAPSASAGGELTYDMRSDHRDSEDFELQTDSDYHRIRVKGGSDGCLCFEKITSVDLIIEISKKIIPSVETDSSNPKRILKMGSIENQSFPNEIVSVESQTEHVLYNKTIGTQFSFEDHRSEWFQNALGNCKFSFTSDDWKKVFGINLSPPKVPSPVIDFAEKVGLISRGDETKWMLAYIPRKVEGKVLTMSRYVEFCEHSGFSMNVDSLILEQRGEEELPFDSWVFMTRDNIKGTKNKKILEQKEVIEKFSTDALVPRVLPTLVLLHLEYTKNLRTFFSIQNSTSCLESIYDASSHKERNIVVGIVDKKIHVLPASDSRRDNIGMAAMCLFQGV